MEGASISAADRLMANLCAVCPLCRRARSTQRGIALKLVKNVETHVCPFCKAYERVNGRKAHEPPQQKPA